MVDPLPPPPQLLTTMGPSLKSEADFLQSISKCHGCATLEVKLSDLRIQMASELLENVDPKEKSEIRRGMLDQYAKSVKDVERERKDYLDKFMQLYPNTDQLKEEVAVDQAKVKRVEEDFKKAKNAYDMYCAAKDPASRAQYTEKYKAALSAYNNNAPRSINELKKSTLERMELTAVFLIIIIIIADLRALDQSRDVLSCEILGETERNHEIG